MKIVSYYLYIKGIFPLTVLLMIVILALAGIQNRNFVLAKIDILVFSFFTFVIFRFYIDGSDHALIRFLTQACLPYILGRMSGNFVSYSFVPSLYIIVGLCAAFTGLEYFVSPSSFEGDRIRLFENNFTETGDEIYGSTQHFSGALFGPAICISLFHILFRETAKEEIFHKKNLLIHQLILFISLAGLIFISSRTALVVTCLICVYLLFKSGGMIRFLRQLGVIVLFTYIVILLTSVERIGFFVNIFSTDLDGVFMEQICFTPELFGSTLYRLSMILDSYGMWISSPFFGVGPGNFGFLDCDTNPEGNFGHPHNLVFGLLSELGLVGFLWFASIVLIPMIKFFRTGYSFFKAQTFILFVFAIGQSFFISAGYLGNFGIYLFIGIFVSYGLNRNHQTAPGDFKEVK